MTEISFSKLVKLVLRHFILILLCALVGLVAAYGYVKAYTSATYTSTIKLMVVTVDQETPNSAVLSTMQRLVNSYVEWLTSRKFYADLIEHYPELESEYGCTASGLYSSVSFSKREDSEAFTCRVTTSTFESCQAAAAALENYIPTYISLRYPDYVKVHVADSATTPFQNRGNLSQMAVFGAVGGGGLAVLFVVLREMSDSRIRSEEDLAERVQLPLLGTIPEFSVTAKKTEPKKAGGTNG